MRGYGGDELAERGREGKESRTHVSVALDASFSFTEAIVPVPNSTLRSTANGSAKVDAKKRERMATWATPARRAEEDRILLWRWARQLRTARRAEEEGGAGGPRCAGVNTQEADDPKEKDPRSVDEEDGRRARLARVMLTREREGRERGSSRAPSRPSGTTAASTVLVATSGLSDEEKLVRRVIERPWLGKRRLGQLGLHIGSVSVPFEVRLLGWERGEVMRRRAARGRRLREAGLVWRVLTWCCRSSELVRGSKGCTKRG